MKRWLKAVVAMIALVAMLMENTYSVYATMDGYTSPEENAEMQVIEVNTEEESAPEVEVSVADDTPVMVEPVAEKENIEEVEDTGIEDTGALLASEDIDESVEVEEFEEVEEQEEQVEAYLEYDEIHGKLKGQGLNNLRISINASELPDDVYYILHIDTYASVEYDGYPIVDNEIPAISNNLSEIYLSNLEYLPFELYVIGENSDEIGAKYFVESEETGFVRMSVNMDGSNVSDDEEEEPEDEVNFVTVTAKIVDEFGDEIDYDFDGDGKEIELAYDEDGIVILDDIDNPPFDNFEIDLGAGKLVKYVYEEARIDDTVISALRQMELTIDAADEETGEDLSETGLVYDYSVSGDEWESLTEDAVVELVYSDGKKTLYEYEDDDVYVSAKLQHANAIPDDAEFVVTPITKDAAGYNYDAYMDALNENSEAILGEEGTIEEEDVLLYDIGFFTIDEEGNSVEVQPQDGSVKIEIRFKKEQLENELANSEEDELTVVHLPLSDEVKESVASTEEATDISVSDIGVEVISDAVTASDEAASFTLNDFSVIALIDNNNKMIAGTSRTFKDILGQAVNFGIVANSMEANSHFETNFAIGNLKGDSQTSACKTSGPAGVSYIGTYNNDSTKGKFTWEQQGANTTNGVLYTTPEALKMMADSMAKKEKATVVTDKYNKNQILKIVSDMVASTAAMTTTLANEDHYMYSNVVRNDTARGGNGEFKLLDIKTLSDNKPGTYYIHFANGEFNNLKKDGDYLTIKLGSDQTVVFTIPDTSVNFGKYYYKIDTPNGTISGSTQGDPIEDQVCRHIIFNCPNATSSTTTNPTAGTFLLPKSSHTLNEVSAGWIVTDSFKINKEWHCVFPDIPSEEPPKPVEEIIKAKKSIDGKKPASYQKFKFTLERYVFGENRYEHVETVENNGEDITFSPIQYSLDMLQGGNEKVFSYRITEEPSPNDGYDHDSVQYLVYHRLKKENNQLKVSVELYKRYGDRDDQTKDWEKINSSEYSQLTFYNMKAASNKYEISVEKLFGDFDFGGENWADQSKDCLIKKYYQGEWPKGAKFKFILRPVESYPSSITVPMPEGTQGEGNNRYKEIVIDENTPDHVASFGKVTVSPNKGIGTWEYVNGKGLKVNYYYVLYSIEEVQIAPDGVKYLPADGYTKRYVKLWVNTYKNSDGSYFVDIEDKESRTNNQELEHCFTHVPGPYQFVNKYVPGELVVNKVVSKNNVKVETNEPFYVVVYSKDSSNKKTYYSTDGTHSNNIIVNTMNVFKGDGRLVFKPLPLGTTYYVEETTSTGEKLESGRKFEYSAPKYSRLGSDNEIKFAAQNTLSKDVTVVSETVTITNTPLERGKITLLKKGRSSKDDKNAVTLSGVTFVLKDDNGKNNGEGERVYVTGSDGVYEYTTEGSTEQLLTTNANGTLTVSNLPVGTYYLQEKDVPERYIKYSERIKFEVGTDGKTVFKGTQNDYVKATSSGVELKFTVYNNRLPAAIRIEKSVVAANGGAIDNNYGPDGYKFNLYDVTGNTDQNVGGTLKGSAETKLVNGKGIATFTGMLEYGHTYRVDEDTTFAAKKGTVLNSFVPRIFTVDENADIYKNSSIGTIGTATYVIMNGVATNKPITGDVKLIKTDSKGVAITEGEAEFFLSKSSNYSNTADRVKVSQVNAGEYKYDSNGSNTVAMTTSNRELVVTGLLPGTYYFYEVKSPDENKYKFDAKYGYQFTIDPLKATNGVDVTYYNDPVKVQNDDFYAKLSFTKVDAFDITKNLSKDTVFKLYEVDASGKYDATKDLASSTYNSQTSKIEVAFAKAANYVLVETTAKKGYATGLEIYLTVLADHNISKHTADLTLADVNATVKKDGRTLKAADFIKDNLVKNEPETGKVTLKKKFVNTPGGANAYIGEATFELYTNSDEYKTANREAGIGNHDAWRQYKVKVDGKEVSEFTTTNQTLVIENLPWGDYYFVEKSTEDAFEFDNTKKYSFSIGENSNGEIIVDVSTFMVEGSELPVDAVENVIKKGSVKIVKKDSDKNEGINGIVFELYKVVNGQAQPVIKDNNGGKYVTDGADGTVGSLTVTDLEYGSYYFVESKDQTVKGYTFDTETKYNFSITGSTDPVTTLTYGTKTITDGVIGNKPIPGKVTLEKWAVVYGTASTQNPTYIKTLEGAEFELYSTNPSNIGQSFVSIFASDDHYYKYGGTYTTNDKGIITVTNLPWGNYKFVETKAPEGYKLPENVAERTYSFIIDGYENNDVFIGRVLGNNKKNYELSGKVPVNEELPGSIKLIKIDYETKDSNNKKPVPNAYFRLFKDGTDYTNKLEVGKNVTTDNIEVIDSSSNKLLVTDEKGEILVKNLPGGKYKFQEVKDRIPEGYTFTASQLNANNEIESVEVEVYATNKEVTLYNTPVRGELYLEKRLDTENGDMLKGATFDLYQISGYNTDNEQYYKVNVEKTSDGVYKCVSVSTDPVGKTSFSGWITELFNKITNGNSSEGSLVATNGTLLVNNLLYGDYKIVEVTPPDGFKPSSAAIEKYFKVDGTKENGPQYDSIVKFINSHVAAGVQFVKKAGDEDLNGIKFILEKYDSESDSYVIVNSTTSAKQMYYAVPAADATVKENSEVGVLDGVVSFEGLAKGTYRIYECSDSAFSLEQSDNKYPYLDVNGNPIWNVPTQDTKYYTFTITGSDDGIFNVGIGGTADENFTENMKTVQVVQNKKKPGKAKLLKQDAVKDANGNVINITGAKFALYEGSVDKNGDPVLGEPSKASPVVGYDELISDNGVIKAENLPWGNYYFVETASSDKTYFLESNINDRPQYHFTIGANSGKFEEWVTAFTVLSKKDAEINKTKTNIAYNKQFFGQAEFAKKDADTLYNIESAAIKFELYKKDSNGVYQKMDEYSGENALTAANGHVITREDLTVGEYYFVEGISADVEPTAPGYEDLPVRDARTKYYFSMEYVENFEKPQFIKGNNFNEDSDGCYVTNNPLPGKITLYKYYVVDEDEIPLDGVTFKLRGKPYNKEKATNSLSGYYEATATSANGMVTFDNIPWGTNYEITEVTPRKGFVLPKAAKDNLPKGITINAAKYEYSYDKSANFKVLNERKPGKINLKKVDQNGKAVGGVLFELQKYDEKSEKWVQIKNSARTDGYFATPDSGFLAWIKRGFAGTGGEIEIDNLEWGKYRLYERAVPEGYQLVEGPYPLDEGYLLLDADHMTNDDNKDYIEYDLGEIENQNVHGNIAVKKVDGKGNGLAGAEFNLYQQKGNDKQGPAVYVTKVSDGLYRYLTMDSSNEGAKKENLVLVSPAGSNAGKIKVVGLPCGTYYMYEITPPNPGVDENGNTIIYKIRDNGEVGPFTVSVDQEEDAEEQQLIPYENDSGDFGAGIIFNKVVKNGGNSVGLGGVKFIVTNKDSGYSWPVYSNSEDGPEKGKVSITITSIGNYSIKEDTTKTDPADDEAYVIDDTEYSFEIVEADDGHYDIKLSDKVKDYDFTKGLKNNNEFVNTEAKGRVKLTKTESESESKIGALNDVSFKLYKKGSSTAIGTYETGKVYDLTGKTVQVGTAGELKISGLEWGTYEFVEVVPDTHTASKAKYEFTIDENSFKKEQHIEIDADNNRKPGSLKLEKKFMGEESWLEYDKVTFKLELVKDTSDIAGFTYRNTLHLIKDGTKYFVEFNNLPWGIYTLKEETTTKGYLLNDTVKTIKIGNSKASEEYAGTIDVYSKVIKDPNDNTKTIIHADLTGDLGFTNEKLKGSVKFLKVDSIKKAPIKNVKFRIYKGTFDGNIGDVVEADSVTFADYPDGVITSDENGYVTFPAKSLEYGQYYIAECVPEGYKYYVKPSENGKDVFTYTGKTVFIDSEATKELTSDKDRFVNEPEYGSVTIKKVDDKGYPIKGVKFTLYAEDAQGANAEDLVKSALRNFFKNLKDWNFSDGASGTVYRTAETDKNGMITIKDLPWGKYHFEEDSVPDGYRELTDAEKSALKLKLTFEIGKENSTGKLYYDWPDFGDAVVNKREEGYVKLTKYGDIPKEGRTDYLLDGAVFNLYKVNGTPDFLNSQYVNDVADDLVKFELTTSSSDKDFGTITYGPVEWGKYYFKEVTPPTGYDLSEKEPDILKVGHILKTEITENGSISYIDVSDGATAALCPSTDVTNNKGYGYVALYKTFDLKGEGEVDTSVAKDDGSKLCFGIKKLNANNQPEGDFISIDGVSEWAVNPVDMMTIAIGPLEYGNYAFIETKVPSGVGYNIPENYFITFTIDKDSSKFVVERERQDIREKKATDPKAIYSFKYVKEFVNTTYRGWSNIAKVDASKAENEEGRYVGGIIFNLYKVSEDTGEITLIGDPIDKISTGTEGIATTNPLPLGKYAFVEDEVSAKNKGFIASKDAFVFEITKENAEAGTRAEVFRAVKKNEDVADKTYTLTTESVPTVENDPYRGSIKLIKKEKDYEISKLQGAVFNLYKVSDPTDELISKDGNTEFTTDENGEIYIDDLEWGTYYFKEVTPPTGYAIIQTEPEKVVISGKDAVETITVSLYNEKLELYISKVELVGESEQPLKGAVLGIFEENGTDPIFKWTSDGTTKRIEKGIKDENGNEFGGLVAGKKYVLKELTVPNGYLPIKDITFSVDADNKVTLYDADAKSAKVKENTPHIVLIDSRSEISISKRELGTSISLSGAKLRLYDDANYQKYINKQDAATVVPEWSSAAEAKIVSGTLTITEDAANPVWYHLVETNAPAGYYKAPDVAFYLTSDNKIVTSDENDSESCGLDADDTMLVMYDKPILVSVKKTNAKDDNTVLAGAKLSIYDADKSSNTVNKTFTTGAVYGSENAVNKLPTLLVPVSAEIVASEKKYQDLTNSYNIIPDAKFVENKKYILHEDSAPDGYKKASDQPFTVTATEIKDLGIFRTAMVDDEIKLYISKKDITGEKELSGANLAIYKENADGTKGEKVVGWTSDGNAHLVSLSTKGENETGLVTGQKYILVEDDAPKGYARTSEVHFEISTLGVVSPSETATINEEEVPLITLKDEPLAICVTKKSTEPQGSSTILYDVLGAKLQLKDGNNILAEWETDGNVAFISEFEPVESSETKTVKNADGTYTINGLKCTYVALKSGCHLDENKTYDVVEIDPVPTGYKKADPKKIMAHKYLSWTEKVKDGVDEYKPLEVYDARDGEIELSGSKTWMVLSDELKAQLAGKKVKINLYRYFYADKNNTEKKYVGSDGKPVTVKDDKDRPVVKFVEISMADQDYSFKKLEKYYYDEKKNGFEYHYEVDEDLTPLGELADKLVSVKDVKNNFINYQRYTDIHGNKNWILLKNADGTSVLDMDMDPILRDAIRALSPQAESAYVDVKIALATVKGDIVQPIMNKAGDDYAYYLNVKHGATSGDKNIEVHDIDASKGETHVEFSWVNPGNVKFGFVNLPLYEYNETTQKLEEIKYTFFEEPIVKSDAGRYTQVNTPEGKIFRDNNTITNMPVTDPFDIKGEKAWKDPFDVKDRPTVTIQLYRDNKLFASQTLDPDKNYAFEFNNLYEYAVDDNYDGVQGHRYTYQLKEVITGKNKDCYPEIVVDFNGVMQRFRGGNGIANILIENKIIQEYIEISGTKTWNNEYNSSRPTVKINLYQKDSTGAEKLLKTTEIRNTSGSTYKFDGLPKYDADGNLYSYRVVEDMTGLGGYISTPAAGYVIVPSAVRGANSYGGNDFVNTPSLIEVRKVEMGTARSLAGAKLRVVDKDGRTVDSWTTNGDDHYIEGLTFGESYTLEETEAPSGYIKADPIKFTVNAESVKSGAIVITMEDPKGNGRVRLTKRDAATREALSGATFRLFTADGRAVHVTGSAGTYTCTDTTSATTSLSVSSEGALTVDELPFGEYYFREISAPRGYKLSADTASFTVYDSESTVEVSFMNERLYGGAYLRKTGPDGRTSLAGAVFELYSAKPRTAGLAAASTIYTDAYYRYGTYTTGADGMLSVTDLPWDDYYFIEVAAPDGYVTNTDVNGDPLVYTFTIDSGSSSSIIGVSMGTITNDTTPPEGGGGGGGTGVAGVRRNGGVLSDVLGVRAKPTSGVLGARVGPVTGDAANIILWLLLLVASISMIIVICIQNHKRNKNTK